MPALAAVLLAVTAVGVVLVVLGLRRVLPLVNPVVVALYLPVAMNAPLLIHLATPVLGDGWRWTIVPPVLLGVVLWVALNVVPVTDGVRVGFRLKALGGAPAILGALAYAVVVEAVVLLLTFVQLGDSVPRWVLLTNLGFALGSCLVLYVNGAGRVVLASKSLSVVGRWFLVTAVWVPLLGWLLGAGASRIARREYRAAVDRVEWERANPEDDRCATRFPVVLVHGVGWRDRDRFDAWGRIPTYLKRHGASVHYGRQQAWGSIVRNAGDLVTQVRAVLAQTGAAKVNLIAHSRGGIDARHAISTLGLGGVVASLTTMNTPHHGVRFADTATRMTPGLYDRVAAAVNAVFRRMGDETPDFQSSTLAFRTADSAEFNRLNPDDPEVWYQSWTSVMSRPSSDRLLSIPFRAITALGEENDGLVAVDSARWGEFRGVLRSTTRRGIGHGDLVDMYREDYHGFDVLDHYVRLVADLRDRGY